MEYYLGYEFMHIISDILVQPNQMGPKQLISAIKIICNMGYLKFLVAKYEISRAFFKTILIVIEERIDNIERFAETIWLTK